ASHGYFFCAGGRRHTSSYGDWSSDVCSSDLQRRGRPVTAPNSFPRSRTSFASRSGISVGNGPPPTLVVYALEIPSTCLIFVGGTPTPVAAPPEVALDEVTNG